MPTVRGLEDEYGDQIRFKRLDATLPENEALQRTYGLRGHPTVVILDTEGAVSSRYSGGKSAELLTAAIQKALAPP